MRPLDSLQDQLQQQLLKYNQALKELSTCLQHNDELQSTIQEQDSLHKQELASLRLKIQMLESKQSFSNLEQEAESSKQCSLIEQHY